MPSVTRTGVKYRDVLETLKGEILSGKYSSSKSFPSLEALVRRFGISRLTAVKAIDRLKELGLVVTQSGRGTFVTKKAVSRKIGLFLPGMAVSEFGHPISHLFWNVARERHYDLVFGKGFSLDYRKRVEEAKDLAASFVRGRVDGVIYQPLEYAADRGETNRRILHLFDRAKIPVVLLASDVTPPPERSAYDLVGINNFAAGGRMVRHLIDRGAKRIVFLTPPNWVASVMQRIKGALAEGDAAHRVESVVAEPGDLAAIRRLMRRRERPDAFICENDRIAAFLCQTLAKLGYSVPDDVMLAGFDYLQIAAMLSPPLTTIHQPGPKLWELAFDRLTARIENPALPVQEICLPAPLTVRESTARKISTSTRKHKENGR